MSDGDATSRTARRSSRDWQDWCSSSTNLSGIAIAFDDYRVFCVEVLNADDIALTLDLVPHQLNSHFDHLPDFLSDLDFDLFTLDLDLFLDLFFNLLFFPNFNRI